MTAVELGSGYVSLLPSARGIGPAIAKEMGAEVEKAADAPATKRAGGTFGKGVGVAFAGAFGLAVVAGAKGFTDALGREATLDELNATLGLSGAQAESAGQIASSLYAGAWGESLDDVTAAIEAVQTNLGGLDDAATFETSTAAALDLAKVLDEDVSSVARSAGQLVRAGLADNAAEAFDLLAAGSQQGLNRAEDLLDTVNEYSPAFARLGLSGEQALGLLEQGLEAGVFNADKIGDAFNEFSIRAIDGSKGTSDALKLLGLDAEDTAAAIAAGGPEAAAATQEILTALRGIDDQVAQDAAGVALFGSIWEDVGSEAILALSPVTAGLDEVDGASGRLSDTLNDNLQTRIESLKRRGFTALADVAADTLVPAMESFFDFVERNGPAALEFFQTKVAPVARQVGRRVLEVFTEIVDFVRDNWPEIRATAEAVFTRIRTAIETVVEIVRALWSEFGDDLISTIQAVWPPIQNAIQAAADVIQGILDTFSALISGDWSAVWDGIKATVSAAWDFIVSITEAVFEFYLGYIEATLEFLDTLFGDTWDAITSTISGALDTIGGALTTAWDGIKSTVSTVWEEITGSITGAIDTIIDAIAGIPDRIFELLGDIFSAGADIANSLLDGIKDALSSAAGFAGDIAKGVGNAIISFINSNIVDRINDGIPNKIPIPGLPDINLPDNPIPRIPGLAAGGVVDPNDPFLAILGDNKTQREIVSPLPVMVEAFEQAMSSGVGGGTTVVHVHNHRTTAGPSDVARGIRLGRIAA